MGVSSSKKKATVGTITKMDNMQLREDANEIARLFYANAILFHVSHPPFYREIFKKVLATWTIPPN